MNKLLLPVAIGVAASVSLPLSTHATESATPEPDAIASSDLPVLADASPMATPPAVAEMPVAQEVAYVEPSGALNFEPKTVKGAAPPVTDSAPARSAEPSSPSTGQDPSPSGKDLFEGGSESFVARTVGAAEGTRTADGGKTQNYHGHVDPGNGVWNRGTFSYQFGNSENLSPDEADRRQLAKIKRIYESVMLTKAEKHGVAPLTLAEEINGIDLINQAPLCVTEEGGYIERLAEAKQKGLTGDEAILNARIWSFWDPGRGGWDAPGLRAYDDMGKEESIRRDQDRRMAMISKAMAAYERENGAIAQETRSKSPVASRPKSVPNREAIADAIISGERRATRG
jgi:hypothetical protein